MKSSAIRHPENSSFIRRHDWQIKAIMSVIPQQDMSKRSDVPYCGAEMMSVLEFHYNNRFGNRIIREMLDKAHTKHGEYHEMGDWMPYSIAYWSDLLMGGRGKWAIGLALKAMSDLGFISLNVPIDIIRFYSANHTWIRFNVDVVNKWIEDNCEKSWRINWRGSKATSMFGATPDATDEVDKQIKPGGRNPGNPTDIETLTTAASKATAIAKFYSHIHGKTSAFVFDASRRTKVEARMKEPGRTLGHAAQAVIGNLYSEYHQGDNEKKQIYDDIELIFRNAPKFDTFVGRAEAQGITEQIAYEELKGFLCGQNSRYAKQRKKPAQTASKGQESTTEPVNEMSDVDALRYRTFAREVAGFFASGVENKTIVEICRDNQSLKEAGAGLTDAAYLDTLIQSAVKTFQPNGLSGELTTQIRQFASTHAKLQEIQAK